MHRNGLRTSNSPFAVRKVSYINAAFTLHGMLSVFRYALCKGESGVFRVWICYVFRCTNDDNCAQRTTLTSLDTPYFLLNLQPLFMPQPLVFCHN